MVLWSCHRAPPAQISTASHTLHILFDLDWDQQLKLQFLVLFRCSCWTCSQGSSFLSLHIDGWPGTGLMGKSLWSFLFYSRVSLFFQVSTIPDQLSQATDWCWESRVRCFPSGSLLLFGCYNTFSVLFSCGYWACSGKRLRIPGKEMGESLMLWISQVLQKDSFFGKIFSICVCFKIQGIVKTPHICITTMKLSYISQMANSIFNNWGL